MAVVFKRKPLPPSTDQEDAEALAEVGLGPTPTLPPPEPKSTPQGPTEAFCGLCGLPLPHTPDSSDLTASVKTDVSLAFEPGDEVRVTNQLHRFIDRYKPGDTGVVLSCRPSGMTENSRYTIVEVRLDKPRKQGHDVVWLHIWELDKACRG